MGKKRFLLALAFMFLLALMPLFASAGLCAVGHTHAGCCADCTTSAWRCTANDESQNRICDPTGHNACSGCDIMAICGCDSSRCGAECENNADCNGCGGTTRYWGYSCSGSCTCTGGSSENCATKLSTDSDGGNPAIQGTCTDYVTCSGGACTSATYTDVCVSGTSLTECYNSGASCPCTAYGCSSVEVAASDSYGNDFTYTEACTAGTGAGCASGAFSTTAGSGGTDYCAGTCGTGVNSCIFVEYYPMDSADSCPGLDTCTSMTYDADTEANTCNQCMGAGYWALGGEVAPAACCGDDSGEFIRTEENYSMAIAFDNDQSACCNLGSDCVGGTSCYTTQAAGTTYNGLNLGGNDNYSHCYNNAGTGQWLDCDQIDFMDYWCGNVCGPKKGVKNPRSAAPYPPDPSWNAVNSGEANVGEYPNTATLGCCGDDTGEFYKSNPLLGTAACCNNVNDCVDSSGACISGGGVESIAQGNCADGIDNDCDGTIDGCDATCFEGWSNDYSENKRCCADEFNNDGVNGRDKDDRGCCDLCTGINLSTSQIRIFANDSFNSNYFGDSCGVSFSDWQTYNGGTMLGDCCGNDPGEYYKNITVGPTTYHACCNSTLSCVNSTGKCQAGIENTPVLCTNNKDDNCDGLIDVLDPDCSGFISGHVYDERLNPIMGAIVKGNPPGLPAEYQSQSQPTDYMGEYTLSAFAGNYSLIARKEGYDDNVTFLIIGANSVINNLNFVLRNGSCHADCTDYYGNCNPACNGITFNTSTGLHTCKFNTTECYYRPKGFRATRKTTTYEHDGIITVTISQYACCEGTAVNYTARKATITGDVENLVITSYKVKKGEEVIEMKIAYWKNLIK